ncbi:zinc finger protein 852 [Anabrus simplex]|uniref:zinc finger protein 852 n=1 Tax=Anabrus simplex TaxID=316456 RepID=UPI0035A387D5
MERPLFIKCEPAWPSDTEQQPSNFEQNDFLCSTNEVKIKKDPHTMVADSILEEIDIKMVEDSCSVKDEVEELYDECDDRGGSTHDVGNAALFAGTSVHSCDFCQKIFSRSSSLKRHLLTHKEQRPHFCTICNRAFTLQAHLKNHMLNHSETRLFKCGMIKVTVFKCVPTMCQI